MRIILELLKQCLLFEMQDKSKQKQSDSRYFCRRRLGPIYVRKKAVVRKFWIVAGIVMLFEPFLHVILVVGAFTTFVSFMYLDEC